MRSRHADRQRAIAVLYEADLRGDDVSVVVARTTDDDPLAPFTATLVEGVAHQQAELDGLIVRYARGWNLDRMPVVDRNLLRLGLWELLHSDVPVAVVIDEAVELANELSTPDSGRFINGVLAAVAREEADVAAARGSAPTHGGGATSL
ncbi:MAG: transcription antitermination factor NusB [Actinobacteria bacterium]|nr:transcription antitermination factor NusB [Actinomycetota bacterium]